MDELPFPPDDWRVGLHVWVERAGQAIVGKGRLELLESIDRCRSISAAAREMGMSYRHAWEQVQTINAAAGEPLVKAATGGAHGGGAQLTPLGRWTLTVFRELQGRLDNTASAILPQLTQRSGGTDLHVAAAVSLEDVLGRLLNDYAVQQPDVRVRVVFGASDELAAHLLAGAPGDLFLTADARQLDRLESARLLLPGSRVALAGNSLAVIGSDALALAVRKPVDLAGTAVSRIALAAAACPLGDYTRAYLDSLRLYEPLLPRAVWVENSRAVVTAVRAGQAEVGLVYSSDAVRADGCRTLFRVRRTPIPIHYAGAVLRRGTDAAAARSLLDFLTSATASRCFRQCGFHPARIGSNSKC